MTGLEFSNIFDLKIDKAYSGFFNPTKKNRLFKEALVIAIETKYKELGKQKEYDEIRTLIKANQVFAPSSNMVPLSLLGVFDYQHLLAFKAKFSQLVPDVNITNATNATPIVITVEGQNNFRTGEAFDISGVVGNWNATGFRYFKKINSKKFALYSDPALTVPVAGNGAYVSGGIISKSYYNYGAQLLPNTKLSVLAQATLNYPKYEMAQNFITIYPLNVVCSEITIDYISNATVFIDSANTTVNLEDTYPLKFLYYVCDVASQKFAESVKDGELFQTAGFETKVNE